MAMLEGKGGRVFFVCWLICLYHGTERVLSGRLPHTQPSPVYVSVALTDSGRHPSLQGKLGGKDLALSSAIRRGGLCWDQEGQEALSLAWLPAASATEPRFNSVLLLFPVLRLSSADVHTCMTNLGKGNNYLLLRK